MTNRETVDKPREAGKHNSARVADLLNILLANFFALYLKTKNFHWHVSGPHFREYHLMFDEQAAELIAATDVIAERVRKIGLPTLRSIGDISRHQSLKDNDEDHIPADKMLTELHGDNVKLLGLLRDLKAAADDAGDNATSADVDGWIDSAENRIWFLRETSRPG